MTNDADSRPLHPLVMRQTRCHMKMLEDDEDPFVPSPSEARRFRRLDKMPENERLKATVRMFLDAISGVPMRAIDCDQMLVDELWSRLREETKPSRKNRRAR